MITKHLIIHGRVQGVFYRAWTVDTASRLSLSGWVRNRHDGTVEALVHGPEEQVLRLIDECKKGPPAADVSRIDVTEADFDDTSGFFQKPTA